MNGTTGRLRSATPDRREGLAWLGRRPEAKATLRLRMLYALGRFAGRRILGLALRVDGLDRLPSGGYILASAIHRSWIDPVALVAALPDSPRLWFLGSAETVFRSRVRGRLMRMLGGFLPVWRGGTDLTVHVEAAEAVLDAGGAFAIFAEGSRRGGAASVEPLRRGTLLIGLRTGAPIVPIALAGTHELYRGRRIAVRALPPTTALELAGLDTPPEPGSAEELRATHVGSEALRSQLQPHVAELATWCEDPPTAPRRWSWLSRIVA